MKGWTSTKASRGHRIVHQDQDGTMHIVYAGLHYEGVDMPARTSTRFQTWYAVGSTGMAKTAAPWFHGSSNNGPAFDRFDFDKGKGGDDAEEYADDRHWNSHMGAHFTSDQDVAENIADNGAGHVYHVSLAMKNPKHYDSEHDMDREATHWAADHQMTDIPKGDIDSLEPGDHRTVLESQENVKEVAHGFRDHLKSQGHDGVTYGNEWEGPRGHKCAIAFHPDDIKINKVHRPYED